MDAETIAELELLAFVALEAADRFTPADAAQAAVAYDAVRSRACTLNRHQGWAKPEEFDVLFPTLDTQREIEALEHHYGALASKEQELGASEQRLLWHLAAWITGVLRARSLGDETGAGD